MGQFDFMRMALMPKIRPPGEALSAQLSGEAPEQGVAKIGGTGGGVIDLNLSVQHTINRQHKQERKRTYSIVRVNYTRPDGTLDPNQFVEYEVLNKVDFLDYSSDEYADPEIKDNMQLISTGNTRYNQ